MAEINRRGGIPKKVKLKARAKQKQEYGQKIEQGITLNPTLIQR